MYNFSPFCWASSPHSLPLPLSPRLSAPPPQPPTTPTPSSATQGLIFVVDSNDRERAKEARDELEKMVRLCHASAEMRWETAGFPLTTAPCYPALAVGGRAARRRCSHLCQQAGAHRFFRRVSQRNPNPKPAFPGLPCRSHCLSPSAHTPFCRAGLAQRNDPRRDYGEARFGTDAEPPGMFKRAE